METRRLGEVTVVEMMPRVDSETAFAAEKEIKEILQGGTLHLVINLGKTAYVSSAGLRVLLTTYKSLRSAGGGMALCCPLPFVKEILDTAGFTSLLSLHESEEEAVQGLASGKGVTP